MIQGLKKLIITLSVIGFVMISSFAHAQQGCVNPDPFSVLCNPTPNPGGGSSIQQLISSFGGILSQLIPLAAGIALLYFLWGLTTFIWVSGDAKQHQQGKSKMIWGITALFVMVSIWGIIDLLRSNLLGIAPTNPPVDPCIADPNLPPC